ncbi:RNA polymerase sigma factor [Paenibacillus yanchengensis]|uniref:RNA polymerase sigma factor n=1 Tax=Paenibacillus yanchengensis TaxID=2035833 RepID=A0ABW4YKS4_9BACL
MLSEQKLYDQWMQGNSDALDRIIKRHYNYIFAYIYRYCSDYHLAYDLTQETFIKMVRHIHTLKNIEQLRHWLLKIALNTCRDHFKIRSNQMIQKEVEYEDAISEQLGQQKDSLAQMDDAMLIQQLLQMLPDYQRETIILRYYYDLKITDIAELTDTELSTVKSRLKQGIEKLQKHQLHVR